MRRLLDVLMAVAILGALALAAAWLTRRSEDLLAGPAFAIDGDTLAFGRDHVRLLGLDAPEIDQICERGGEPTACGKEARAVLKTLLTARLRCESRSRDIYGRMLASCSTEAGDIGERLVDAGVAVNTGGYLLAEARARAARRGLWAGSFDMPSAWRKAHTATRP